MKYAESTVPLTLDRPASRGRKFTGNSLIRVAAPRKNPNNP